MLYVVCRALFVARCLVRVESCLACDMGCLLLVVDGLFDKCYLSSAVC